MNTRPLWTVVTATGLLALSTQGRAQALDQDRDGVDDRIDNCTAAANKDQRDTDADGLGNRCDADLNNDGKVSELDLALMRKRLGTTDPDADLDGDGRVTQADVELLRAQLSRAPGPSSVAVPADSTLDANPPVPEQVDVFATGSGEKNVPGMILMKFSSGTLRARKIGRTLVIAPDGNGSVLNDLGVAPDRVAGDNVFSGAVTLTASPSAVRAKLTKLGTKLASQGSAMDANFRGRALIERKARPFSFEIVAPQPPLPGLEAFPKFVLPGGFFALPPICEEERCLMIRDLSVVADPTRTFDPCDTDGDGNLGDPNGAWSFKTLLKNMANEPVTGTPAPQFVHYWLSHWLSNINNGFTNTHTIPHRQAGMTTQILSQLPNWNSGDPLALTDADLDKLPFRLLAIVNRNDLAGGGYGNSASGEPSEIRFVFGLLQKTATQCRPHPSGMGVIFEFKDRTGCMQVGARADEWVALDHDHPAFPVSAPFTPVASYNAALQAITDQVTAANAKPTEPNGSSLNQLRTNDIALGSIWELREFRIDAATQRLEPHTLAQTPDASFHRTATLRDCINDVSCRTEVPLVFGGQNLLAASQSYSQGFFFDAPGVAVNQTRRDFSTNTCGGCHGGNAFNPLVTFGPAGLNLVPPYAPSFSSVPEAFYHVDARTPGGRRATLSRFLKGTDTTAPFTPIPDRVIDSPSLGAVNFDDLDRRNRVLAAQSFGSFGCGTVVPVIMNQLPTGPVLNPFLFEQVSLPITH